MDDVEDVLDKLNRAMHFMGVSSTDPEGDDGVTILSLPEYVPTSGDVVIYLRDEKIPTEYVYDGSKWQQLGDESLAADQIAALNSELEQVKSETNPNPLNLKIKQEAGLITEISGSIAEETFDAYGAAAIVRGNTELTVADNASAIATIQGTDKNESMRTVANDVMTTAISELSSSVNAGTGKYIKSITQANGILTGAEYGDVPTIPPIDFSEESPSTETEAEVVVVSRLEVDNHAVTAYHTKVATLAGLNGALSGLNNNDVAEAG
jgi:hypothetical protein